jgi:ABC-type antimicrobial peptide transport system permease subunit
MSIHKLIFRSLQFYWRAHLGVLLGTILACAILTGALVVGDSVRFSLKQMALARLGQTTLALTSGDRFFRADLAQPLAERLQAPIVPLLMLRGAVTTPEGTRRANEVQVVGVDDRFWNFSPSAAAGNPATNRYARDEIAVSESLANRLQLHRGDPLVVRLEPPALVTRDLPLEGQADASVAIRLRVRSIVGDEQFGRFTLQGNQVPALSVFLPLDELQAEIHRTGRANVLLVGQRPSPQCDVATANAALAAHWNLSDADLELRELRGPNEFELRTKRVFLDPVVADAAFAVASNAVGVLTYFVNEIRCGDRATPYSFVAATASSQAGVPLGDDEITINNWLADDLGAKPGSEVTLRYFVLGERRELQEQTATFRVREIIPVKSDPSWMPDFPGLADTRNCREWKPGIPINLDRIRPQDELYWNNYSGTPKAFVTLAAGQRLWANRFGNLTAIRFPSGIQTVKTTDDEIEHSLLAKIEPAALGFAFTDVRERALLACEKSQDFGQLFLGFSFFLMVAAFLLTALLFVFQLEQRNAQVGLLRALGFSDRKVRWLFLSEGICVAGLGTLLGLLAGVAFTQLTLRGLATIWRGAVGTSNFLYHAEASSLLTGAGLSLVAAIGAMALAQRGQIRRSLASLLASGAEVESGGAIAGPFRARLGLGIGVAGWFGALVLMTTGGRGHGPEMAGVFFCSGLLVLCAGLGFTQHLLVRLTQPPQLAHSIAQLGWRNAGRRRTRSLTTVSVLAVGVFMVVAVNAFRQNPRSAAQDRPSGTGGFALYGQSTLPIYEDLNAASGRAAFNLPAATMHDVAVVPLRIREGDDASCLNLDRALQPRLLSVRPDEMQRRHAFAFGQWLDQKASAGRGTAGANQGGWDLLNQPSAAGVVPAIGDEQTVRWALGKSLGDTIAYTDDRGRDFQVQIVGLLANSILQGGLLISEPDFIEHFPSVAGYRAFLVDAPPDRTEAVAELLTHQLQDKGLELQPAWQRLADFMAVENTYLGIFQALGGLGLLLGSLGLGIVVLRNVLERRQELALLQAVGFRPSQLQRLVLSEHWLLVVLGLVIGLGAALAAIFPALPVADAAAPSITMSLTLLALAVAGFFWCWLATRVALHGPLLDALRKE